MRRSRVSNGPWFLTFRLGVLLSAWLWWALRPSTAWVLVPAAVPVLIAAIRSRRLGPPLVHVGLAAFLLTALVAIWATYDRDASRLIFAHPVGWQKLWGLILAGLLFYTLVAVGSAHEVRLACGLLAGLVSIVAGGFVFTNDWVAQPALWEPVTRLGQAVQDVGRILLPPLPQGVLNPNVAGGLVASFLPLGIGLAVEGRRLRDPLWVALGSLTAAIMAFAVVLTTSRGAWLGLGGALSLTVLWWMGGKLTSTLRRAGLGWADRVSRILIFTITLAVLAAVAGLAWTSLAPLRRSILTSGPVVNRLSIFSQAAPLVRDYPLTGSGLGTFPLVHSTYSLMIHVPVLSHAHALPLNVALEQGLIGADALLLVWGTAAWMGLQALGGEAEEKTELERANMSRALLGAALASLAALMIHSLADDAIYSSRGILFLWAPAALILAAARPSRVPRAVERPEVPHRSGPAAQPRPHPRPTVRRRLLIVAAIALIATLSTLAYRSLAAIYHSNLGAVLQTFVELRAYSYEHFGDPSLDQIRRQEDISAAIYHYERAVALDPEQVTARTRLSQIALARRDYDAALRHALVAWDAGYRDRVVRLTLGDALVGHGQVEEAAEVVQGLEKVQTRLAGQALAYERYDDWRRAAYAWRTVLALDLGNDRVRAAAARAEERAAQP